MLDLVTMVTSSITMVTGIHSVGLSMKRPLDKVAAKRKISRLIGHLVIILRVRCDWPVFLDTASYWATEWNIF